MNKRFFLTLSLVFVVFVLFYPAQIQSASQKTGASEQKNTDVLIKEGDDLYALRSDVRNVLKAINKYKAALEMDGKNYEAVWRISRAYYYYGSDLPEDDDKGRMKIFDNGIRYAKLAVKLADNRVEGHFWLGVNYGTWGEANGVMKSLSLRHDIEDEMLKAAKYDESYEGAGAYRVLGRLKYRLPGLFGGDNDLSIEYLRKAIKICPSHTMNYVFLAETLMEEDQYSEAKTLLEKVLSMEPGPRWIPEAKKDKEKAKELLKEVMEELSD